MSRESTYRLIAKNKKREILHGDVYNYAMRIESLVDEIKSKPEESQERRLEEIQDYCVAIRVFVEEFK